jgi:hypothetical protein
MEERKMMTDRDASGFGLAAAAARTTLAHVEDDIRDANKRTVLAFYDAALNRLNIDEAAAYFGPQFINHNPRGQGWDRGISLVVPGPEKAIPRT